MTDGWFLPLLLGISLPQVDARWLELRVLEESSADFVSDGSKFQDRYRGCRLSACSVFRNKKKVVLRCLAAMNYGKLLVLTSSLLVPVYFDL